MGKRKVCIFTGTRAEYGLLKPLMDEIKSDPDLELQIVASCMHLSPEFGLTYQQIEKDGFNIDEKVEMLLSSDTPSGIVKSMGLGMIGYTDALNRLKPDITVVLGDRFEALAFAIASFVNRIPIAHLYGGEITEGAIDDAFRHSITKLSYLHFTSTEEYRKRVIQLGEEPERVFNVGALGIDNIKKMKLLNKDEIESKLDIKFKSKNLLITYHPVTLKKDESEKEFKALLNVLREMEDTLFIFTKPNADTEGRKIIKLIEEFVKENNHKAILFTSLGQLNYLSIMQYVDAVVGNSSSGIIEAPSLKVPTINIGDRQKGRIRAKSIIDCKGTEEDIKRALDIIFDKKFRETIKNISNPYGDGNSARKIKNILKHSKISIIKKFYEINFEIED
ncbi:UDP-N-acetylglucosamine 2-epimerase [Sulfurihydrogenibium yellowstonense]|uniref:UDP-N-acetyl-D-glucosamine 2-epimerase, UDP-hydrolysing n=1 Tax=Sulfurihydrogenibium yellowstonense SS-5 TaxID=432331 RepID=C4FID7_9AQUI|nr:UDP-N-acetylglucosamine 2-epimerase [Sulfurihydrogenibium yellowstonense]EEP61155.1 UDP-N-acetyl-D-glucosamine 2-epimerase, UDP-hydrolysing [Sulfurihydrogenibium yellowstonense SS-5]